MTALYLPTVLWLTDRGDWHQARALEAAPPDLRVIIRRRPPLDELLRLLSDCDYIITERAEPVTAEMIAAAPHLKHILRLGSLMVGIDREAAQARGISISMQPVVGTIYCAEHALMMILAVIKRLGRGMDAALSAGNGKPAARTDEDTFAFNWLGLTDIGGLFGKTVAILGMGEIGVELARMLRPLHTKAVLYNKRQPYPDAVNRELGITFAPNEACYQAADVIVSLLPYAAETDLSINAAAFSQMKRGAMLVQVGSGSVINESDLLAALASGQLAGAALDTYEYEPLQADHPLVAYARDPRSNLLLTPHTAAASLVSSRTDDYAEILRHWRGEPLQYLGSP